MTRTKNQKKLIYIIYGLIGVAFLAIFAYVLIIRPFQIRQQKASFDKAEASLDSLATQIAATIGKPDETKKKKTCGYASRVSGRGPRGCSVSINILYRNKDEIYANNSLSAFSKRINTKLYDSLGRSSVNAFEKYSGRGPDQSFSQSFEAPPQLNCSVRYSYPVIQLGNQAFDELSGENLHIETSCGGPAMSEFYPEDK